MQEDPALRRRLGGCLDTHRSEFIDMLRKGPCQPILDEYPDDGHGFSFHHRFFKKHPFLEFSVSTGKMFCFACMMFSSIRERHVRKTASVPVGG